MNVGLQGLQQEESFAGMNGAPRAKPSTLVVARVVARVVSP